MIGLPTETREDIAGIIDLAKKVRARSKKGYITLSISTFVPKPFTPFQWHPMAPLKEVKERLKLIKKGLMQEKGVRVFHDVPKYAYMQGLFASGNRGTAALSKGSRQMTPLRSKTGLTKGPWTFLSSEKKIYLKIFRGILSMQASQRKNSGRSTKRRSKGEYSPCLFFILCPCAVRRPCPRTTVYAYCQRIAKERSKGRPLIILGHGLLEITLVILLFFKVTPFFTGPDARLFISVAGESY